MARLYEYNGNVGRERGKEKRELIEYHATSNNKCRGYRIEWARRIYDNPWLSPSKVFALELCPFHSREYRRIGNLRNNGESISFIKKNVIDAAVQAMNEGKLPFVLGVGGDLRGVLQTIGARVETLWSHDNHPQGWDWPRYESGSKRGQLIKRTYSLHTVTGENGMPGRILITSAQGGLTAPRPEFSAIESHIREACSNLGQE